MRKSYFIFLELLDIYISAFLNLWNKVAQFVPNPLNFYKQNSIWDAVEPQLQPRLGCFGAAWLHCYLFGATWLLGFVWYCKKSKSRYFCARFFVLKLLRNLIISTQHRFNASQIVLPPYWYQTPNYTEQTLVDAWKQVIQRSKMSKMSKKNLTLDSFWFD